MIDKYALIWGKYRNLSKQDNIINETPKPMHITLVPDYITIQSTTIAKDNGIITVHNLSEYRKTKQSLVLLPEVKTGIDKLTFNKENLKNKNLIL